MSNNQKILVKISLKLITLFFIIGSLSAQDILDRTVELKRTDYAIQNLMNELRDVHSLSISYGQLPEKSEISFDSKTQTVRQILDKAFSGTSHNYQVVNRKILIVKKSKSSDKTNKATINGFIRDIESGEALIGATIYDKKSGSGVISNNYGFFSLTLLKDTINLSISYLGFETQNFPLNLSQDLTINFDMESDSEILEEVTVEAEAFESVEVTPNMSTISLTAKQIENVPMILGEHDILKAIQLLPGVQGGTEGSSGIYVRGGGPDQNLFLMDGVPVYNTSHIFGFFSIFNGDAINNIEVIKGGFPAKYGGRLSSVIDISMKEGNNQRMSGKGSVGILSSKFMIEGPIKNENTSFIFSGRRTFLDIVTIPLDLRDNNNFFFYDFNAKINHRFSNKDRVFLSFYGGSDTYEFGSEELIHFNNNTPIKKTNNSGIKWGNIISVFRWNHIFSPKLFGTFSTYVSRFRFNTNHIRSIPNVSENNVSTKSFEYGSGVRDYAVKTSFEYEMTPKYQLEFGGSAVAHQFKTGVIKLNSTDELEGNSGKITNATEYAGYLENDISLGKKLRINVGVHASLFNVNNTSYKSLQPRASARVLLKNQLSFKASYAEMRQFIHLLTHSGPGLPTDLWVPATDVVKPQFSRQVAMGAAKVFGSFEITLEGYFKEMENLIEYENGASYLSTDTDWENKVEIGTGESYGIEFLFRKNAGRLTGWVGYTLSKATRQFDQLNSGRPFPFRYDRRHDISVVGTYKINNHWTFSGNWVFGSGSNTSLPSSKYFSNGYNRRTGSFDPLSLLQLTWENPEIHNFTKRNDYQLRSYHRLDISFSHSKIKKRGTRVWTIGVYNLYSRLNPFYVYIDQEINPDFQNSDIFFVPTLKQGSLLPAIPFINYSFKF